MVQNMPKNLGLILRINYWYMLCIFQLMLFFYAVGYLSLSGCIILYLANAVVTVLLYWMDSSKVFLILGAKFLCTVYIRSLFYIVEDSIEY